ncbi:AAA family ATPase, partial [Candidatus Woesearchaeota archaeon]|nr:AAA family ATPase [Candidatus Woesearchaeota archaeon]
MKRELVPGFPINEFSRSYGLFTLGDEVKPHFLNCHGGIDHWELTLFGGHVEQHFQQFSEVHAIEGSNESLERFLSTIESYRKKGLAVTAHAPFLSAHSPDNPQFLGFDFQWLVVPDRYKEIPVKSFNMGDRKVVISGIESRIEDFYRTIDLVARAGIEYLTIHITAAGTLLNDQELPRFAAGVGDLGSYIQKKHGGKVKLLLETGGTAPEQAATLCDTVQQLSGYAPLINLDTAHALLDLMELKRTELLRQGASPQDAANEVLKQLPRLNDAIVEFYLREQGRIPVIHLTQTDPYADKHRNIAERGIVACNEQIIRAADGLFAQRQNNLPYVMIESKPTQRDFVFFYTTKLGEQKVDLRSINKAVMVAGQPSSGKSTVIEYLAGEGFFPPDDWARVSTSEIRRSYDHNRFTIPDWVGKNYRQLAYDVGFQDCGSALEQGDGIVFDATFDQRRNRASLAKIAQEHGVKDFYVLQLTCGIDEEKERMMAKKGLSGENHHDSLSTMTQPEKLDRFIKEEEPFDPSEEYKDYPFDLHVVKIDTSRDNPSIALVNPDSFTRNLVHAL